MALRDEFEEKFPEDDVIWSFEGSSKKYCEENEALVFLFDQEFCLMVGNFIVPGTDTSQVKISVLANDVFMWACADAEPLTMDQIPILYMMVKLDPKWGSIKWCCLQRNMQPQAPMLRDIKKDGSWDEEFELLEKNPDNQS